MTVSNAQDGTGSRVLITGATGFIGARLVPALLEAGYRVRALVRDPARAADLGDAEIAQGDLLRPESLAGVESDVDVVVHCASILGKWGTPESEIHRVNVTGTQNLLDRFSDRPLRRFLHLSAGGVSGPVATRSVDESYVCRPATAYERTKLTAEQAVLASAGDGLAATVVRPTFTYGPGDPHKLALFRAVKKGRYAFVGDGLSVNHPVFIEDLVRGILLALEHASSGEVYIIGGPQPETKRDLIYAIADGLGVTRPRLRIPRGIAWPAACVLEAVGRALGFEPILTRSRVMMMADNFGYSIDKARRELGYEPRMELRPGIERTIESYRAAGLL
ncbi:MAG: NAD-dependent epimerase/dehydratase family protein [bacterium]|nr:NAD-dependent epimerase/dehydratase family protein [bacterium]